MSGTPQEKAPLPPALFVVLFGLPLLVLLVKLPIWPISDLVAEQVSLATLPEKLQHRLAHILFVPLGAMLVVLVRLSLGLRVLGPFRSILLAVAFQSVGTGPGLLFLAVTVAIVVGLRPSIGAMQMPYFGRITVMLSTVAAMMVAGVLIGQWGGVALLQKIVYFPMVVLCLVADAFARTMKQEGLRSALWRGGMTALVAVVLSALAGIPGVQRLMIHYPELIVAQIGAIVFISRHCDWRALERFNPKVGVDEEDKYEKEVFRSRAQKKPPVAATEDLRAETSRSGQQAGEATQPSAFTQ